MQENGGRAKEVQERCQNTMKPDPEGRSKRETEKK